MEAYLEILDQELASDTFQSLTGMDEDEEEVAHDLETEVARQEAAADSTHLVEVINFADIPLPDPVDLTPVVDTLQTGFLFVSFLIAAILGYLISRDIVGGLIR